MRHFLHDLIGIQIIRGANFLKNAFGFVKSSQEQCIPSNSAKVSSAVFVAHVALANHNTELQPCGNKLLRNYSCHIWANEYAQNFQVGKGQRTNQNYRNQVGSDQQMQKLENKLNLEILENKQQLTPTVQSVFLSSVYRKCSQL